MQIDEYETIRLMDYVGLTQEECARQMMVARTTVTAIYESARKKIADSLVNGKRLMIQGGEISVCERNNNGCNRRCFRQCEQCLQHGTPLCLSTSHSEISCCSCCKTQLDTEDK